MYKCHASVKNLLIFVVFNVYSRHCALNLERNDFLGIILTASSRFKSGHTDRLYRTKHLTLPNRTNFCKNVCKTLKNVYLCSCIKRGLLFNGCKGLEYEAAWSNISILLYVSTMRRTIKYRGNFTLSSFLIFQYFPLFFVFLVLSSLFHIPPSVWHDFFQHLPSYALSLCLMFQYKIFVLLFLSNIL